MTQNARAMEELRAFMDQIPFNRLLHLQVKELSPGFAKMWVPFREDLIGDTLRRALHGGVISAALDTCGGAAAWTACEEGDRVSTVDLRVDYLRPGREEDICVEARVLRLGNRVGVVEMTAYHPGSEDEPIASGKGVYNVRRSAD